MTSLELIACTFLSVLAITSVDADPVRHAPTLEDAFAVTSVGNVAANPKDSAVAVEVGSRIEIEEVTGGTIKLPFGTSQPVWSPDGQTLAFYISEQSVNQLAIYDRATNAVSVVTHQPDGISPNPWAGITADSEFSWSADSRRIVFASRHMPNFQQLGAVEKDLPVRVYDRLSALPFTQLNGIFRFPDQWEAFGDPVGAARMRASERNPMVASDHIYVLDIRARSVKELPDSIGCRMPAWSPRNDVIAAMCDPRPETYHRTVLDVTPAAELVLFHYASGNRRVASANPFPYVARPRWSPDGKALAMVVQKRLIGFRWVELYDSQSDTWRIVDTQGHSAAQDAQLRWARKSGELVVKVENRGTFDLLAIKSGNSLIHHLRVSDAYVKAFDIGANDDLAYVAEGSSYSGRVFQLSWASGDTRLIADENRQLNSVWLAPRRHVTWTNSRGELVDGILLLPPDYVAGKRYPVVADVYPGHATDAFRLVPTSQVIGDMTAAKGYVVFLPALRSPVGFYAFPRDEAYSEEARGVPGIGLLIDDFTSGLRFLESLGIIDPLRVGLFGHSNGGYTVNLLITETQVARCAAVSAGASNYFMVVTGAEDGPGTRAELSDGNYYDTPETYWRLSPWFRLNRVSIPLFLFDGDMDWEWTLQMSAEYGSLRNLGRDVTWVRYRDEEHWFTKPENIRDSFDRVMKFFDKNLKDVELNHSE